MLDDLVRDTLALCAIPAPTFAEGERAAAVVGAARGRRPSSRLRDDAGNVLARVGGDGPVVVVAAHLDTVFPAGTTCTPRRERGRLYGPGIGDNCVAVATLIELGRLLARTRRAPSQPVLLAATVGEEGLGDLRGIRAVLDAQPATAVIALEGHGIDSVVTVGIASARYVATYRGPGGHSWRDRDRPSAVHALLEAGRAAVAEGAPAQRQRRRRRRRAVGQLGRRRGADGDRRAGRDRRRGRGGLRPHREGAGGRCRAASTPTSCRPAGGPAGGCRAVTRCCARCAARAPAPGSAPAREDAASTDANAALAREIPAVTLGLTRGAGIHREDEWIELAPLAAGAATVFHLVHRLAGLPAPRGLV